MTPLDFQNLKGKRKLSMVTCYDYSFAKLLDATAVDSILVGDSGSMVMSGHDTTVKANLEDLVFFTSSVARGSRNKLIIADMPFLSFRKSIDAGLDAAQALMQAGAHALKLEGIRGHESLVGRLVESGIPVMGHLGLTPQHVHGLGGYKVQGRSEDSANRIEADALTLQELGVFSIVLECLPTSLAARLSKKLIVPTIGIGAGPDTDGQVLVLQDLLGLNVDMKPKFVRNYLNGQELVQSAFEKFHSDVVSGQFPGPQESYQ